MRKPKLFVGIDPGASGSISILSEKGLFGCLLFDNEEETIVRYLASLKKKEYEVVVALEQVHAMPNQGVTGMFKFGKSYGFLRACVLCNGWAIINVRADKWQRGIGIPVKGDKSKDEHKLVLLNKAKKLYPRIKLWNVPKSKGRQLQLCDSLLIAHWLKETQ